MSASSISSNVNHQTDSEFFAIVPPDSQIQILSYLDPKSMGKVQLASKKFYSMTSEEYFEKEYWEKLYKKDLADIPLPPKHISFQKAYKIQQNIISSFIKNPSIVQNRLVPANLNELFRQALLREDTISEENSFFSQVKPFIQSANLEDVQKILALIPKNLVFKEIGQTPYFFKEVYMNDRHFKEGSLQEVKNIVEKTLRYGMEAKRIHTAVDNPYKEFASKAQAKGYWETLLYKPFNPLKEIKEKICDPAIAAFSSKRESAPEKEKTGFLAWLFYIFTSF